MKKQTHVLTVCSPITEGMRSVYTRRRSRSRLNVWHVVRTLTGWSKAWLSAALYTNNSICQQQLWLQLSAVGKRSQTAGAECALNPLCCHRLYKGVAQIWNSVRLHWSGFGCCSVELKLNGNRKRGSCCNWRSQSHDDKGHLVGKFNASQ